MRNLKLVVNNIFNNNEREIFFVKKELQTILNLYGKMVSNGTWKDYGVSIGPREISFDIYQRASEKPIYKILKNLKPKNYNEKFYILHASFFISYFFIKCRISYILWL